MTRSLCVASLILLLLVAGCGPDRPTTIPVQARVTFAGGPPPAEGNLIFAPLKAAEGYQLRPAFGAFNAAGEVVVTSFETGDGLVPGRYEVKVECWSVPPNEENPGESHVPASYVPQEIEVSASDKVVELNVDVPK